MRSGSGYADVEASLDDRVSQRQFWIALMIFPGRFVAKPPSKFEDRLITYAPPQLLVLFAFRLFAPRGFLEYALFTGHASSDADESAVLNWQY